MNQSGIGKLDLKRCNRQQILKLLFTRGSMSRIEIADALGLTRAAITILTSEMLQQGTLVENNHPAASSNELRRGRKKVLLEIAYHQHLAFGTYISENQVCVGLSDLTGGILSKRSEPISESLDPEQIFDIVTRSVNMIKEENFIPDDQILGMGFCVPSYMQAPFMSPSDLDELIDRLKKTLQTDVVTERQMPALALANIDFAKSTNPSESPRHLALIRFGSETESAVILHNTPYYGTDLHSQSLAHILVDPQSKTICPVCGLHGCLSNAFSEQTLKRQIRSIYSEQQTPYLYREQKPGAISSGNYTLDQDYLLKDKSVRKIFSAACKPLSIALINVFQTINPDRLILAGSMFENKTMAEYLLKSLKKHMPGNMAARLYPNFIAADSACLAGCCIAIRRLFIEPGGRINP